MKIYESVRAHLDVKSQEGGRGAHWPILYTYVQFLRFVIRGVATHDWSRTPKIARSYRHGGMLGLRDTTIASPQDQSASMRHHGSGGACIVSVDGGFGVIQVSGSLQQGIQQSEHLRGKGWAYPCQVSSVTSSATRPAWSALIGEGRLGGAQVLVASGCQASCRHDTAALDLWQ